MAAHSQGASLILIGKWEQQMSSSGCCGRLEKDVLAWSGNDEPCLSERRRIMEGAGCLYREVRERYAEEMEIRVVDPRNLLSLLPILFRDFGLYRAGPLAAQDLAEVSLRDEGIMVLGIQRETGDLLILYGRDEALDRLDDRPTGAEGERKHQEGVQDQEEEQRSQERQEARRNAEEKKEEEGVEEGGEE